MDGDIGVKSNLNKGSIFWFTATFENSVVSNNLLSLNSEQIYINLEKLSRLKILLVEDTLINQQVILTQLKFIKINADHVNNGQEALQHLETNRYDIILMDCLMPVLDGYETTLAIRKNENYGHNIIIIALTANVLKEAREKCFQVGMDDYISKPLDLKTLALTLNHWADKLGFNTPEIDKKENYISLDNLLGNDNEKSLFNIYNYSLIDLDSLEQLTTGNKEFQSIILNTYLEDAVHIFQKIQHFLNVQDFISLGQMAHKLRGMSATLAIKDIAEISKQIEINADNNNSNNLEILVKELDQMMKQVKDCIEKIVA